MLPTCHQQHTSQSRELFQRDPIFRDVDDYATLTGERWLTGSVIDTICLELMSEQRHHHCIFLPSLAQHWASTSDAKFLASKLEQFVLSNCTDATRWLLTPNHLTNHWGLLCLDFVTKEAYFDEGLNMDPPHKTVEVAHSIIQCVMDTTQRWDIPQLKRFGMPEQPTSGIGSGSCGVSVVLAVRHFLASSFNNFPVFLWDFCEMTYHRQQLMWQLLKCICE